MFGQLVFVFREEEAEQGAGDVDRWPDTWRLRVTLSATCGHLNHLGATLLLAWPARAAVSVGSSRPQRQPGSDSNANGNVFIV